ncbi:MAG: hypothetical protein M3069_11370 [Chloroflexota bacterium]|nr:hypothetical protein [Chloroflexota bacterium]
MPVQLGIDAYSLKWQGWTAVETLEYAARLGVANVQFSERGFLDSLDVGYLHDLRGPADELLCRSRSEGSAANDRPAPRAQRPLVPTSSERRALALLSGRDR